MTRLNDSIVCSYPYIYHYKAAETQPHKSKVAALQLHDGDAAFLTLVWKVMHCCCTSICLGPMQFPWYTAWPQHLLSPQHEGKIHICPSAFALSLSVLTFPQLLQHQFTALRIPDEGLGHRLPWGPIHGMPSHHFHPPTSPSSSTMVKLSLYHPAMYFPIPCWFNQPQRSRSIITPSMADGTFLYRLKTLIHCWLTVILKPGPSTSSCLIRLLK